MTFADWRLDRFANGPMGTFGQLNGPGLDEPLWTVERPGNSNADSASAIPHGTYDLSLYDSTKYKTRCLWVQGVPGRDEIAMHPANLSRELRGCIAPGLYLGAIDKLWAVHRSRDALALLVAAVELELHVGRRPRLVIQAVDRAWPTVEHLGVPPIAVAA